MSSLYLFSGPCGCGKTTLTNLWAQHLVKNLDQLQTYVIHGDDFHRCFVETEKRLGENYPGFLYWKDILNFIWECMLSTAESALQRGLDVVMDYVVEDELPAVKVLAEKHNASLYYIVLTASEDVLRQRLIQRGDPHLMERSLFLKRKLDSTPENQGHLLDCSQKPPHQLISELDMKHYLLP